MSVVEVTVVSECMVSMGSDEYRFMQAGRHGYRCVFPAVQAVVRAR
jgi:hypothetical protein